MNTKKFNKNTKPIMRTKEGLDIIGTEVDAFNKLHYIIRDKNGIRLEKYNKYKVEIIFDRDVSETKVHKSK